MSHLYQKETLKLKTKARRSIKAHNSTHAKQCCFGSRARPQIQTQVFSYRVEQQENGALHRPLVDLFKQTTQQCSTQGINTQIGTVSTQIPINHANVQCFAQPGPVTHPTAD